MRDVKPNGVVPLAYETPRTRPGRWRAAITLATALISFAAGAVYFVGTLAWGTDDLAWSSFMMIIALTCFACTWLLIRQTVALMRGQ